MADNPWDAADMAIVAMRLTQHLTGLLVAKQVISHDELQDVYDTVGRQLEADPSGTDALAYFRAITPTALQRP